MRFEIYKGSTKEGEVQVDVESGVLKRAVLLHSTAPLTKILRYYRNLDQALNRLYKSTSFTFKGIG